MPDSICTFTIEEETRRVSFRCISKQKEQNRAGHSIHTIKDE
jgi:hypothetical protein